MYQVGQCQNSGCSIETRVPSCANTATIAVMKGSHLQLGPDSFQDVPLTELVLFYDVARIHETAFNVSQITKLSILEYSAANPNHMIDKQRVLFFTNVEELTIQHRLEKIYYASLDGLENLKVLTLSNNNIRQLDSPFTSNVMLNLRKLNLSNNPLLTLDRAVLNKMPKLTHLDVSNCQLSTFASFSDIGFLKVFYGNNNRFNEPLGSVFDDKLLLEILDVSNNAISGMEAGALSNTNIMYLNISDNCVQYIQGLPDPLRIRCLANTLDFTNAGNINCDSDWGAYSQCMINT